MKTFLCLALSCVLISFVQADLSKIITVAVVEGAPALSNETDPDKTLIDTNVAKYMKSLDANKYKPDILILPEYGLTGRTDDVSLAIDLSDLKENLTLLNQEAGKRKLLIVASVLEKDGDDLYSTTLVLNGNASLVAKYRKTNLNETEKNLKTENDVVTFKHPSSGITIGLLSGDDILYKEPAHKLLKEDSVTTLIYTSSMASIGPFRTAVSLHAGFAYAHGVNLLVASLSDPKNGVSGSGIYQPCKMNQYVTANEGTKIIVATIDAKPNAKCTKNLRDVLLFGTKLHATGKPISDLPRYNYDGLQTEIIDANVTNKEKCDGSFCCKFNISSTSWNKNEFYRLAVTKDQKVCCLISCTEKDKVETCGRISQATAATAFTEITITSDGDDMFMPYILHSDMTPGSNLYDVKFVENDDGTNFNITGVSDVIAVGIVAANSGANSLPLLASSMIAIFFLLKLL